MGTHKSLEVPASLARLKQRFAAWRKKRVAGQRIPDSLWNSAVKMAAKHGVSRTACFLKVDYYSLKKRAESASSPAMSSTFVELPPAALSMMSECVIELEDAMGSRMRVQLKGQNPPDDRSSPPRFSFTRTYYGMRHQTTLFASEKRDDLMGRQRA